ncbi:unnamed protein product [Symbiodinium sp. CCMP2592]|nr:unnamed protein product [Symbiodinium sp. CCMP2592]
MTWRQRGTLPYYCSSNLTPHLYLKMLYYFASDADYKTCLRECGIKAKVWRVLVEKLRGILWLVAGAQHQEQIGGRDRIVAVDETFFTKKKRARGGFAGRHTAGHDTLVLGMIELDLRTRRATGRCRLQVIPNRKKATLKRHLMQHVVPGSLVFTDGLKSYGWMSARDSPFVHRQSQEEGIQQGRDGQEINVSSNAAEGLFGRLKSYVRRRGIKRVSRQCYGKVLAEFLWRQTCSAKQEEPFSELLNEILLWQFRHPHAAKHAPSLESSVPEDLKADFANLVEDEMPEAPRQAPAPLEPVHQPPAPPDESEMPQVEVAAPVLPPRRAPQEAVEAFLAQAPQPAAASLHPGPLQAESSTDSEVELVLYKPAPKKARTSGPAIKKEGSTADHVSLPVFSPPRVKLEPLYCRQGHALMFEDPPAQVVLNQRECVYYEVTCDVCGAMSPQGTYKCKACNWEICERRARANSRPRLLT